MVAHRGNLNYQDCRRTVTAGFEPGEIDVLQEASVDVASVSNKASDYLSSSSSVVPLEASQKGDRVRFSVKITSAVILASEFWKVAGFDWYGQWENIRPFAAQGCPIFVSLSQWTDVPCLEPYLFQVVSYGV